jgi:hypothetical protein
MGWMADSTRLKVKIYISRVLYTLQAKGASPGHYVGTNEDGTKNNLVLYMVYGMIHQKRGGGALRAAD